MSTTQTRHDELVSGEHGGSAAKATGGHVSLDLSAWLLPIIAVMAILCGLAIGLAISSQNEAAKAEREARVMQERWNDLKVELAKRGIPVSDH